MFGEKPNKYEKLRDKYRFYYIINFNIELDEENHYYTWESVKLPHGEFDYESIVNAMISYKYPTDKMQAIINNYLLDKNDPNSIKEFNDMQAWRKYSKEYAKDILK